MSKLKPRGNAAALVQRLSPLRLELLVGLLDGRIGLGVNAGAEPAGGMLAGDGLGLAQLLAGPTPGNPFHELAALDRDDVVDRRMGLGGGLGRMGVQARFVHPQSLVGGQAGLAGRVDADRPVAADVVAVVDRVQAGRRRWRRRDWASARPWSGPRCGRCHGSRSPRSRRRSARRHRWARRRPCPATRRQSGRGSSAGRTAGEPRGPVPGLAGRFPAKEMVGNLPGFVGRRMGAERLDLLRELVDLALELRFQAGIAHPGGHGTVVSQRGPQIGKPLQLQPFIARGQFVVDIAENGLVGLGLGQFALEFVPGKIFLPAIGRSARPWQNADRERRPRP